MLIAAVDFSTSQVSAALVELRGFDLSVLSERTELCEDAPRLPGILIDLTQDAGRALRDVQGYAVGLGPGPQKQLKVALTTVKGLALANQRQLVGVSSLEAMALAAVGQAPTSAVLVPVVSDGVTLFAGFFKTDVVTGGLVSVEREGAFTPPQLSRKVARIEGAQLFGQGLSMLPADLKAPRLPAAPPLPQAWALARLASRALQRSSAFSAREIFALQPFSSNVSLNAVRV